MSRVSGRSALIEEEDLLLTIAYLQLQILSKTRQKDAIRRIGLCGSETGCSAVVYSQYEKLVAELREEDARGSLQNRKYEIITLRRK